MLPEFLHDSIKEYFKVSKKKYVLDLSKYFSIHFSGEEGWFQASNAQRVLIVSSSGFPLRDIKMNIITKLDAEDPQVVFYNEQTTGEPLQSKYPMVRVELNSDIPLPKCKLGNGDNSEACCLKKDNSDNSVDIGCPENIGSICPFND